MVSNFQSKTVTANGGTLAYEIAGTGPLILCLPGVGDLRQVYRPLALNLVEAGYRVMLADLRGHGESSAGWSRYDVPALASDIAPLLDAEVTEKALLIGNSISGASILLFAAHHPERVAGLVGLAPIRRDPFAGVKGKLMRSLLQLLVENPWGIWIWSQYYRTLYPTLSPHTLDNHVRALQTNLREPGRFASTKALLFAGRELSHFSSVRSPILDFIGTADPDFDDPAAEAAWIKSQTPQAEVHLLDGIGHYPQRECSQLILPQILAFVDQTMGTHSPRETVAR